MRGGGMMRGLLQCKAARKSALLKKPASLERSYYRFTRVPVLWKL